MRAAATRNARHQQGHYGQCSERRVDLFGDRPIRRGQVTLDMPVVAEDGRVVPVIIEAPDLPMTGTNYVKAVHLIVDHNPDPHLAAFDVTPAMGRLSLQFRIKMKRTCWIRAIVESIPLWPSAAALDRVRGLVDRADGKREVRFRIAVQVEARQRARE
mgnify:CR=1 FL=1